MAFSYSKIKEVLIPASVKSMGGSVFGSSSSLTTVTYLGTKPDAIKHNGDVFKGYTSIQTLIVPNAENISDPAWKTFLGGNFTEVKQHK